MRWTRVAGACWDRSEEPSRPGGGVRLTVWGRAMGSTDYTGAIAVMVAVALALTAMVVYVLSRPTDLGK